MGFNVLSLNILGIGFSKSGNIAPWIATISIPLGAIIYWIKRSSLLYNYEIEENVKEKERLRKEHEETNETNENLKLN